MVNRKKWSTQEVAKLKSLIEFNMSLEEVAGKLNKTPGAVIMKCQRLGLPLQPKGCVDRGISLPKELPTIEKTMHILAGAMEAARKPGLTKDAARRVQIVANIARAYKEMAVDYFRYESVERRLKEVEEDNAQLRKMVEELKKATPKTSAQ